MKYKYIEVLRKLDEVREKHREVKKEFEPIWEDLACTVLIEKLQGAEYNWGFWQAVKDVMRQNNMEEIKI